MDVPEKRRLDIKSILANDSSISVGNLSRIFNVSQITIRRDLQKLEEEGILEKVHGGAISKNIKSGQYPSFLEDINLNKEQKERIAKAAADEVNDGCSFILESGTTCMEVIYNLGAKKNLSVYTASVLLAYELWKIALHRSDFDVSICGGLVEKKSNILIGSYATNFFYNINADIAFIGAVAVSLEKGVIASHSQLDADVTRAIAANARKKILLVDSSKFRKSEPITVLNLKSFDKVITDTGLAHDDLLKLKNIVNDVSLV